MNGATAAGMLRQRVKSRIVGVPDQCVTLAPDEALAIADLLKPENGDAPITHAEIVRMREFIHSQGQQLIAMGAAMRMLRAFVLSPIEFEISGDVAAYMAAWIDDGRWLSLKWPDQFPELGKFLIDIGFVRDGDIIGLPKEQIGDRAMAAAQREAS